ncbi:MAG: outer membrane protein OmpA-like peptidoglycan-associated protein [Candidatus Endobugula sp.]|jgi:outer membrane protein OmpA-like peptidoglycan-associated protein
MIISRSIIAVVTTIGVLAGCTTQDAYTGESKVNRATTYGAIGAVVCAAIGSRKNSKRARNSAAVCGLAGAGVGAYMDNQERILRAELVGSGVQVIREGDNLRLVMPNNITFRVDQAILNSSIYGTLNSVVKILNEFNETRLQIAGHTDSSGKATYNQKLSIRRANSVSDYLKSQEVSVDRLVVFGYGESRPIASNATDTGRAENRRVELLIEPNG